jgi:hypothetical protein
MENHSLYFDRGLAHAVWLENNFELRDVGGATVVAARNDNVQR